MTARLLPGGPAADALLARVKADVASMASPPHLHVIRLGEDPASVSYVRLKDRRAREVGLRSTVHALPEGTTEATLLALIDRLNADADASGILVQLPLPAHVNAARVIEAIDPRKDVDGFHPSAVGRLWSGGVALPPCTPQGVMVLLEHYGVQVAGRHAVIVGRSNIVGKPLAALLLRADATVTVAHSRTPDLGSVTRLADLLFVAVGRAHVVTADMVRPGATVVDVGVNRVLSDGRERLTGDVHPDVMNVAGALTPVPGGVGPMTVAQLLANTVLAARLQADSSAVAAQNGTL